MALSSQVSFRDYRTQSLHKLHWRPRSSHPIPSTPGAAVDPRIERTRQAVRRATLEVLGSRGYAAFTVGAVSETARGGKSTISRHGPTRPALAADALEPLNEQPRPVVTAGT